MNFMLLNTEVQPVIGVDVIERYKRAEHFTRLLPSR
jgi:hypothetical protein